MSSVQDHFWGDPRPDHSTKFTPGPAWRRRQATPFGSVSAQEAAVGLVNALGREKAVTYARALLACVDVEAARDRAKDARGAGL